MTRDLSLVPEVEDLGCYRAVYEQWPEYRTLYVETSRGCFKECTFCEVAKTGAAWSPFRKVPLDTVFRTISMGVEAFGVNYVLVADSIATLYRREFIQLMQQVGSRWPGVAVQFNSTVDCWDAERAAACREVPCTVWFGFESGSPRILEIIRKGTTVERAYAAARLCQDHEIPCAFNVLLGVPGETEADYAQTLEVFERCPWIYPNPNIFNPLPGTALHGYCSANDLLRVPRDYSIWDAEKIRSRGAGPVRGVDYDLVLHNHARLTQMQAEPLRSLSRS